ncbi:hypothetical protein SLEP1_g32243 [Rubroshorea leprosula]|uniref:Uncharacterized protein n=1 Tax=Rubroshorea leprosula TaxID=152421 RepID=A0AAV5KCQ8_9ROSI|nr:hypothetical protein SLEP1_g32243 [Rubroshorea leprosula]
MHRPACCEKEGQKKGPWTAEEDQKLVAYIQQHGHGSWRALPEKAGLQRCGKSCRLRWINYLRPDIKRGKFTLLEERTIIQLHALLGNRWSVIATHLPKRTDNEIKNHWHTHLKKRLIKMGIDPMTHKPKADAMVSPAGGGKNAANLSHMAQWESARLEAEARLVGRRSKLVSSPTQNPSHLLTNKTVAPRAARPKCIDVLKAWQCLVAGMFSFASHGTLESPTSTLKFPYSGANIQVPEDSILSFNGEKYLDRANKMQEFEGTSDPNFIDMSAWFEDPFRAGNDIANIMEELSEDIMGNSGVMKMNSSMMRVEKSKNMESCSGIITVENRDYWNSLHSLVSSSSAVGSPVF